jgi:hypothetical protein
LSTLLTKRSKYDKFLINFNQQNHKFKISTYEKYHFFFWKVDLSKNKIIVKDHFYFNHIIHKNIIENLMEFINYFYKKFFGEGSEDNEILEFSIKNTCKIKQTDHFNCGPICCLEFIENKNKEIFLSVDDLNTKCNTFRKKYLLEILNVLELKYQKIITTDSKEIIIKDFKLKIEKELEII